MHYTGPFCLFPRIAGLAESFVVFLPAARQRAALFVSRVFDVWLIKEITSQWLAVSGDERPVYGDLFCPVLD